MTLAKWIGLGALWAALLCLGVAYGSVWIPLPDVFRALIGQQGSAQWESIIWLIRIPRVVTACLAGAALAAGGLQMQTLFRNPLADPFILGTNAGASVGVAILVMLAGQAGYGWTATMLGEVGVVGAAAIGAGLVLLLTLGLTRSVATTQLLLIGLMIGYLSGALVSLLLFFGTRERVQAYLVWTYGSFGGVTWEQIRIFAPTVLIGVGVAGISTKSLDLLLLGEETAASLGVSLRWTRARLLVSTALLAGSVTAFCGPIGFVGLVAPHLSRFFWQTARHQTILPASMVLGSCLTLAADLLIRLPGSQQTLPLNAITAMLGAPVVLWMILRQRNNR